MRPIDFIRVALFDLRSAKLRSLLTGLGVIIGVGSVALLLSLGEGVRSQVGSAFTDLGTSRIVVSPASSSVGPGVSTITLADVAAIAALPDVLDAAPVISLPELVGTPGLVIPAATPVAGAPLSPGATPVPATAGLRISVVGTDPAYFAIAGMDFLAGGPFDASGIVIDDAAMAALFGPTAVPADAIGRSVTIGDETLSVSGVVRNPLAAIASGMGGARTGSGSGDAGGSSFGGGALTAASVYRAIGPLMASSGQPFVAQAQLRARDATAVEVVRAEVRDLLVERHGVADVTVISLARILDQVNQALSVITGFLAALAAISLLVGGIGIMNIMLAVVAERTREIGIIRALGATRRTVVGQFLTEAIAISLLGGAIGLLLAYLGTVAAQNLLDIPSEINTSIITLALGVSTLVGVIFGVLPAYRAARLDPISALRHD